MAVVGLIGRIAVQHKLVTPDQLRQATREQARRPDKRLGEILVELGFIDEAQLGVLLAAQKRIEQRRKAPRRPTPPPMRREVPEQVALGSIALKRVAQSKGDESKGDDERTEDGAGSGGRAVGTVDWAFPGSGRNTAEAREDGPEVERSASRRWLESTLAEAFESGSAELLILPDRPAKLRRYGLLHEFTVGVITADGAREVLYDVLDSRQRATLEEQGDVTIALDIDGVGRFRVMVYREHRGYAGVFRRTLSNPPSLEELCLPTSFAKLAGFPRGLLVVAGPTGGGKSATLAALIDLINEERSDHIVTLEQPIECIHQSRRALISQREVGTHVPSYEDGLRSALREDADVICIDELRDPGAVAVALASAAGQHLVIATVAADRAVEAIEQLLAAVPSSERPLACSMFADALRAVVCQRLLPTADGQGVVPVHEIIDGDVAVRNLLAADQLAQLRSLLESGRSRGSRALDDSLARLVRDGQVSLQVARANAQNPRNLIPPT